MSSTFAIPEQTFLALTAVKLGRFITNIKKPHLNYHDPQVVSDVEELTRDGQKLEQGFKSEASTSLTAEITRILQASFAKQGKATGTIKTDQYKIHEMGNTKRWFKNAIKEDQTTRDWFEESMQDGEDIYLVTGYLTVKDAHVEQHGSKREQTGLETRLPTREAIKSSTGVDPGDGADIKLTAKHDRAGSADAKFDAANEQICSVQFQQVCFSWYSSKKVDKAFLEKDTVWKAYRTFRSNKEVLDIVEAFLEDGDTGDTGSEIKIV